MAYCGQPSLLDYFNTSTAGPSLEKSVVCPFLDGGAGMDPAVLALFIFGPVGLALAYRNRHPAPMLVAGILTGGVAAISAPASLMNVLALVLLIGISAGAYYLYQKSKRSL